MATFSTIFEKFVDKISTMRYHSGVDESSTTTYSRGGGESMTDVELLKKKIKESGLKESAIAGKLGISRTSWYYKRKNKSPFKVNEINALCDILHITSLREKERIFFSNM